MSAQTQTNYGSLVWRRFRRHRLALAGIITVLVVAVASVCAPLLSPYDPVKPKLDQKLETPSPQHVLGTDKLGRDVLTRLLYGGQMSLAIGFTAALISAVLGTLVGMLAGTRGGWLDGMLMRLVDVLLAFPAIFLLMIVFAAAESRSPATVAAFLGAFGWLYLARVVRGELLSVRELDYVAASRALGVGDTHLILKHFLPNLAGPIIVATTLAVAFNMLAEGSMSYLSFGVSDDVPTWGNMLAGSAEYYEKAPLLAIAPGMMLVLVVLAVNFVGDGLRDALDPRA